MKVHYGFSQLPDFQKAVITIGSFDGVHEGHRRLLQRVRDAAQTVAGVSVAITFDPHPRAFFDKGGADFRLIDTTDEKIRLLSECGIDHVVIVPFNAEFAAMSAEAYVRDFLLRYFRPHSIVIGYDHRFGQDRSGGLAFLQQFADKGHFELIEVPAQEVDQITVSSSKIRRAIEAGDMEAAQRLLGRPFLLSGIVVEGDRIGRTIGFPTANLSLQNPWKIVPPSGIYAAYVYAEGRAQPYRGMLYIGQRPTIAGAREQRIEVNLLDFEGDLYGQNLRLEVRKRMRGDEKQNNLSELQARIRADQSAIEQWLEQAEAAHTPEIAVVILNYNTRRHLEHYLPSVLQHSPGAKIVVADNGSPDDSIAFLHAQYPMVEVLDLAQNWGFAEGYNQALRRVKADIYVILNSDVEVTAGWMDPILQAMQADPGIAVAQPKILEDKRRDRFEHAGAAGGWVDFLGYPFCKGRIFTHVEQDSGQYDQPSPCFWAAGAAFFIRAELYHRFGGFDGDYFAHNEEIDLCWRLKRAGYSVWCIPQSRVYHLGGGTLGYESPRKAFLNFRNSLYTIVKNETRKKLYWLIPARLLLDGVAAAMYLSKRNFGAIKAIWDAHIDFYKNWGKIWQKRKETAAIVAQNARPLQMPDRAGVFKGSIVWNYYIRRIKNFSDIIQDIPDKV